MGPALWTLVGQRIANGLRAIHAECQDHGTRLLLLRYPPSEVNPCHGVVNTVISQVASSRGIPLLDLGQVLGPVRRGPYNPLFSNGGHPSDVGYARIARRVLERLVAQGWVGPGGREGGGQGSQGQDQQLSDR